MHENDLRRKDFIASLRFDTKLEGRDEVLRAIDLADRLAGENADVAAFRDGLNWVMAQPIDFDEKFNRIKELKTEYSGGFVRIASLKAFLEEFS